MEQRQLQPPTSNVYEQVNSPHQEDLLRRKEKRKKLLVWVVLFFVIQCLVIVFFAAVYMKVKPPKFRLRSATLHGFVSSPNNSSFRGTLNGTMGVKNPNFGSFKYPNSSVQFFYLGSYLVGEAHVVGSKAGIKSTKKVNFQVNLLSDHITATDHKQRLQSDLNSENLTLTVRSTLKGRVKLMFGMMKKKKSSEMDCTLTIDSSNKAIREFKCK
ncbi:unnamed protein product [Cuscuta europaea]|uniref:Late embryogenesis abundant protein LEA-2 subgroup domain-containing protein n=1 Tax=Cuscuta europaea TaxID=41803 RepID=A0A9P1EKV3_CUSEU|nr:unnamed protein product [Cuscuta europaea]